MEDRLHTPLFDTLQFAKKLENAGMANTTAEAVAEGLRDIFDENLHASMLSKAEGKGIENKIDRIENKIDLLEGRIDAKLLKSEIRVILWVVGLLFTQTAIIISILKFIH